MPGGILRTGGGGLFARPGTGFFMIGLVPQVYRLFLAKEGTSLARVFMSFTPANPPPEVETDDLVIAKIAVCARVCSSLSCALVGRPAGRAHLNTREMPIPAREKAAA